MDPHRKLGIYVGYLSPSIIKYLEPLTGDLFTAEYADCMFNEDHFPMLGEEFKYHTECQEINWDSIDTLKVDPRTKETELQVERIIELQHIANNLPDAFTIIIPHKECAGKNRGTKQNYSSTISRRER